MLKSNYTEVKLFVIVFFFVSSSLFSQEVSRVKDTQQEVKGTKKKNFLQRVWGTELESSVIFMPLGTHTVSGPDVLYVWYTAYNYKSFEVSIFKNSYEDWTLSLYYKRTAHLSKRFTLNYGIGLILGYKGKLGNHRNIPLSSTFLFTGNLNPVVGLNFDYRISKKWSIHTGLSPLVLIYGLRYYL